jgi:hypothetical protein
MKLYLVFDSALLKADRKLDVLVSYAEGQRTIASALGIAESAFLDSGAFSAWKRNTKIDLLKYCDFVNEHSERFDLVAGLDVIGNVKESRKNYAIMRRMCRRVILPTHHIGSPDSDLQSLLAEGWTYIALGGMVGILKSADRGKLWSSLSRKFELIQSYKGVRVHGFGCNWLKLLIGFPWDSVDATTYKVGTMYGKVLGGLRGGLAQVETSKALSAALDGAVSPETALVALKKAKRSDAAVDIANAIELLKTVQIINEVKHAKARAQDMQL